MLTPSPIKLPSAKLPFAAIVMGLCLLSAATVQAQERTSIFENLVAVEGAPVAMAFIDPKADFGSFKRVMILDPYVSFRANWQRDQNRASRSQRVSARDMERIRADVAALFRDVFTERLQANDGFEIVNEPDDDVLLLRPAIIDLDITAPDTRTPGRSTTFTASTGAATIYLEMFDSASGAIIGVAADRQSARSSSNNLTWSNRVTNTQEARRMLGNWADILRGFLDSHYMQNVKKD